MKLDDIMAQWGADGSMENTEMGNESLRIPLLHHKYYKILIEESLLFKKVEYEYKTLLKIKYEYFMGVLDKETLSERGWNPNPLKILKQDLSIYIDGDSDLQSIQIKIDIQKQKLAFLWIDVA